MVDPITAISVGSQVASTIGGLFGKKKSKQVDQARPYFRPVNDTVGEMDKLRDWLESTSNFVERPMRAMTQDEMTNPIFKQNAVMDIKNYFADKAGNEAIQEEPYDGADLKRIGRDYVQAYGASPQVSRNYWDKLSRTANFDYEAIAKALLDTQKDGSTFNKNEAYLRQVGLGYMPKALPKGVSMPTHGVPL